VANNIERKEINIEMKNVERAIMSLRNGRIYGLEDICAELLKCETKKLYLIWAI